jgi:hypothetical protein
MLITLPLILTAPAALVSQTPKPPNLEQVLARHFEAMGGLDKLASIKSTRITGKTELSQVAIETNPPDLVRYETSSRDMKTILATDGKGGWASVNHFTEAITIKGLMTIRVLSNVGRSPFIDYKTKGYNVKYQGLINYGDSKAHKISLAHSRDGFILCYFLDSSSYLPIKVEASYLKTKGTLTSTFLFNNYKKINDISVARSIEILNHEVVAPEHFPAGIRPPSNNPSRIITIEKFEVNQKINNSRFQAPSGNCFRTYVPLQKRRLSPFALPTSRNTPFRPHPRR